VAPAGRLPLPYVRNCSSTWARSGVAGDDDGMTMPDDLRAHNRDLIAQFRADGGASMGDRPLLLLTTIGRRTGEERTTPMMYVRDGDRLMVIASNNGAARDPLWFRNLVTNPDVTVELPGETFPAKAQPLQGPEYDRDWATVKERFPFFADHEQRAAGRQIPVVELIRR
jgi:deazaflavin-dependent oxidoreductase (nitroreductase family)